MTAARIKILAKWVWSVAILGVVIWFCLARWDRIERTLATLPASTIVLGLAAIVVAKLGLMLIMRSAAWRTGLRLSLRDSYWIYTVTQLGKYLPGSVWHFVGRIVILKRRGATTPQIRNSMLAEHGWVLASAPACAAVMFAISPPSASLDQVQNIGRPVLIWFAALAVAAVAAIIWASFHYRGRLLRWLMLRRPPHSALVILAGIWLLLGLSLFITLAPFATITVPWAYVVGVYCIAYVAGFLVPFAPAGLGIRETILTLTLTPFLPTDIAIVLASINRVLYFAAELVVVIPCLFIKDMPEQTIETGPSVVSRN